MAKRYQQPQTGPVNIDTGNPLTAGATVWTSISPLNLFGKRNLKAAGEAGYNSSPVGTAGRARKWARSAGAGIDFGTNQLFTGKAVTVLVVAAPANAAAMKSAFSQRLGSGSYPQVDFIFNGTGDGLSTLAGTVELVTYDGSSIGVTAPAQTDGKVHCWVASNSTTSGYIFRDGVAQALSQNSRIVNAIYATTQKLCIGRLGDDAGSTTYQHDDPLYLVVVWDRQLTLDEARSASSNPWQIFKSSARLFSPAAGGESTLNASASGGNVATGTASLAAQVALAAIGVSTASGAGNLSASIPLSAAGFAVSSGAANATATVTLSAAGLAQAAGQAGLSATVLLAGAAAAQASGNAALAAQLNALAAGAAQASGTASLTGGAPGMLSATGSNVASGSAVLSVTIGLQAAGGDVAGGTANAQANSPGSISATGGAQSAGSATWSATVKLTAAGFVQAMGAGQWSATVSLSAFASASASGSATLAEVGAVLLVPTRGFSINGQRRNFSLSGQRRIYRVSS